MPSSGRWVGYMRWILAVGFAAATTLYGALWMWGIRQDHEVFLGIDFDHSPAAASLSIRRVSADCPAERAGLRVGDRILAIDGRRLDTLEALHRPLHGRPGDRVRLTVERDGLPSPLTLEAVLAARPHGALGSTWTLRLTAEVLGSYPLLFLVVGVVVLFQRVHDPHAWLMALVFAAFIAGAPSVEFEVPSALRGLTVAYQIAFGGASSGLFLYFFSVFPDRSPTDRRAPWIKWLWLSAGIAVALPLSAAALVAGGSRPALLLEASLPRPLVFWSLSAYFFLGYGLGLVSLAWNSLRGSAAARRKGRVIVWGTVLGLGPAFLLNVAAVSQGKEPYQFPLWVWASCVIALLLIPLSFAYAVVKHRVLEIPVLLRRSARYLLVQRGFIGLLLILGLIATGFFALSLSRSLGPGTETTAIGLGTGFGVVLVWTGSQLHRRVRERIDRGFFRRAYDATQILQDLAERARGATSREELAALLEHHLHDALLPESLAIYLEGGGGALEILRGRAPGGGRTIDVALPALAELARRGRPREVPSPGADPSGELTLFAPLAPDCLVPILGRSGNLTGLVVLGARLSEEPYSGEDKRLLASVASQAGIALDSIRLAEQLAARLEAERRAAQEAELAKQVQSRLLPQGSFSRLGMECAGRCVQAQEVGGDYFDFLELGAGRVGLALADISGKGFPAALLMASLQASLRSRLAHDQLDLPRLLASVNQLLYRSSESNRYATLFLGIYEGGSRRLAYANCGHNPPLILRARGEVERLAPTAPVLGLFEEWECTAAEVRLETGDLLVLFSDGITEAFSEGGEEFGEARLLEALRGQRALPVMALVEDVIERVQQFGASQQSDDQTLVVARVAS